MASSPRENGPGSAQRILHALTFFFSFKKKFFFFLS